MLLGGACTRTNIVECIDNTDCEYVSGVCTENSATGHDWCTFSDATCPSGERWADVLTGDDLAGMCVAEGPGPDARPPCDLLVTWSAGSDGQTSPHDIWTSQLDGSDAHPLTDNGNDLVGSAPARWDPAGERIAYQRASTIWLMNADGSNERPITPGSDSAPQWSPDGSRIAYVHTTGAMVALWVVDATGVNAMPLTDPETNNGLHFAWSPDGGRIAFRSNRDGDYEAYVMLADGSGQTNVSNMPAYQDGGEIQWSPDGNSITFLSNRSGEEDLWKMSSTGANPTNLNAAASGALYGYDWYPDGTKIVFGRLDAGFMGSLHVMNADGTGQHPIADDPNTIEIHPSMSPDGTKVVWVRSDSGGMLEIWIADADGANPTRISNNPGPDDNPTIRHCPQ